jgi:hypothetical protein
MRLQWRAPKHETQKAARLPRGRRAHLPKKGGAGADSIGSCSPEQKVAFQLGVKKRLTRITQ